MSLQDNTHNNISNIHKCHYRYDMQYRRERRGGGGGWGAVGAFLLGALLF